MLAKLISLLVHAKAGAISGVFLLGATGALVSVSAANGVTTITVTEASPSPSTSAAVHSAKPAKTPEPEESSEPTPSPSTAAAPVAAPTTACVDEAAAIAAQIKRVDTAFAGFQKDLEALRGTRDAATLKKAELTLQLDRLSAVKAIHATATTACATQDEDANEDTNDQNEQQGDNDDTKTPPPSPASVLSVIETPMANDTENDGKDGKVAITFTGTTPTAIADEAIALMQTAFDAAKNSPVTTPKPALSPKVDTSHAPKADPKKAPVQMDANGHHD